MDADLQNDPADIPSIVNRPAFTRFVGSGRLAREKATPV
jgi:hypothetical protein